ncbi:MAG: HAMP domain-containing sensor histidine kinase [Anaerolineales bacterium]
MSGRRSIRTYLTLSYAVFVLVALGVVDLYWFARQEAAAEAAIRSQLEHQSRLLTTLVDLNNFAGDQVSLPSFYTAVELNLQVAFVAPDLEIHNLSNLPLTDLQERHILSIGSEALKGSTTSREVYGPDQSHESLYGATPVFDDDGNVLGAVCLILPLDSFESTIMQAQIWSLLFVAGVAIASIPFGWIVATWLTRRLSQAQQSAAKVAAGDYELRLPEGGPRELDQLSRSLNQMGEELQRRDRARQILLANMTHELARPLGGIRLGIESLRAGAGDDPETGDSLLTEMSLSIQRMEAMIEDLALSARPKSHPLRLRYSTVALDPLLHGLYSRFSRRAETRGIQLDLQLSESLPSLEADEMRLFQILANLVDNALKYTPTGGRVIIYAEQTPGVIELGVRDTGPGIPEEEADRLLQPFTQGETASDVRQGMGLGLSIVSELVQIHGGELRLENLPGGGLQAAVQLPL